MCDHNGHEVLCYSSPRHSIEQPTISHPNRYRPIGYHHDFLHDWTHDACVVSPCICPGAYFLQSLPQSCLRNRGLPDCRRSVQPGLLQWHHPIHVRPRERWGRMVYSGLEADNLVAGVEGRLDHGTRAVVADVGHTEAAAEDMGRSLVGLAEEVRHCIHVRGAVLSQIGRRRTLTSSLTVPADCLNHMIHTVRRPVRAGSPHVAEGRMSSLFGEVHNQQEHHRIEGLGADSLAADHIPVAEGRVDSQAEGTSSSEGTDCKGRT